MTEFKERVRGRVVVVTGASSGIGEGLSNRLADAGATVVLVARSEEKLAELVQAIEGRGGQASAYGCDLSDAESTQRFIEQVLAEHGRVDMLVNNAGISIRRSVAKSYDRIHDFERTFALNFFGALRLIMAFLPAMREQKSGHIINISTVGVQVNVPRYGAYIASKAALDAFCRVAAIETLRDGVRFTPIYMPLVKTPMMEGTTIYQAFPMRNVAEAVDLIVDAIVRRPRRLTTPLGNVFERAYSVVPGAIELVLHAGYRAYPESGKKEDLKDAPSREAALFKRVFDAATSRATKKRKD